MEGPVGARWAGRTRILRYEVRRSRDGVIADIAEAVDSPRRLTDDPDVARRLWQSAADLPAPVWGRDELGTGEMWNSNSVISWLITRSGLDVDSIRPPTGGRAPGWQAGVVLAGRVPAKPHVSVDVRTGTVLPKEPEEEQSEHDTEAWRDGLGWIGATALMYQLLLRRPILEWGATDAEARARLPSDELLEEADGVATRAITINAPAVPAEERS